LHDPTFSRFDTILECGRYTHAHTEREMDRHSTTAYTALSVVSRGKNRHIARLTKYNYQATSVSG